MELRIIGQQELVVSEPVWYYAFVDLLYVPKVTKSISTPLDIKATRQLQYHWIRNKHQSLTNSNENTIFHDSHFKYRLSYIRKFLSIVKMQPIENLLGSFYFAWTKNTLVISPPSTGRSRSSHLSLSHQRLVHDILSVTL